MQEGQETGFEIGKYFETLLRQWRLILGATLICAIVAGVVSYLQPKVYQARVLIASTNVGTNITLGSTIETLSEEQLGYRLGGSTARLQSYVQMVDNPSIANSVLDEIGGELPEGLRSTNAILKLVTGRVAEKSDSIEILIRHEDPQIAIAIANAWGKAYVEWVNDIYSSDTSKEALKAVKGKKEESKATYEKAQKNLESFIAKSELDDFTRQVEETKSLVTNLSTARTLAASTIITNTSTAQLTSFNEKILDLQEQLKQAYSNSRKVDQLLKDARDMRDQIKSGGEGAARSNALALTLLKTQVFAAYGEGLTALQIQTNPSVLTAGEMVMDLGGLISTLESRQVSLNTEVEAISQELIDLESVPNTLSAETVSNPPTQITGGEASLQAFLNMKGLDGIVSSVGGDLPLEKTIGELENKISVLQSKIAKETDRQQELTRARDLAWQTYSNLATKEAEFEISTESLGKEVALASPAGINERNTRDLARNLVIAALVGFLFGVGVAFIIEYWWSYQGIQPRPITLKITRGK